MAAYDDGPVAAIHAEALRGLIDFIETRAPDATEDDDVRHSRTLSICSTRFRLSTPLGLSQLLGERHSREVGLIE